MSMTFETERLKQACMADDAVMRKLTEIRENGSGWGTPGPRNLDTSALHCHYSYSGGIAFRWSGSDVHILALGVKNDKAKQGNNKYDWDTNGNP